MEHKMITQIPPPKGRPTIYTIENSVWTPRRCSNNIAVYSAADVLARVLGGDNKYRISTVYFEFGSPVAISPTRADAKLYYDGLAGNDFIRASVISSATYTSGGPDYEGNIVNFVASTRGLTTGVKNGLSIVGTQVYGLALVASPDPDDVSKDVIFARWYGFSPIAKVSGQEIGVQWPVEFT